MNSRVQATGSKLGEFSSHSGESSTFPVHVSSCLPCAIKHDNGWSRSGSKLAKAILGQSWFEKMELGSYPENTLKSFIINNNLLFTRRTEVQKKNNNLFYIESNKWPSSHE